MEFIIVYATETKRSVDKLWSNDSNRFYLILSRNYLRLWHPDSALLSHFALPTVAENGAYERDTTVRSMFLPVTIFISCDKASRRSEPSRVCRQVGPPSTRSKTASYLLGPLIGDDHHISVRTIRSFDMTWCDMICKMQRGALAIVLVITYAYLESVYLVPNTPLPPSSAWAHLAAKKDDNEDKISRIV
jgi:hypothetical protein